MKKVKEKNKLFYEKIGLREEKRKMLHYIKNENTLSWKGEKYVWTRTGDSLFLRDSEGALVLWKSY